MVTPIQIIVPADDTDGTREWWRKAPAPTLAFSSRATRASRQGTWLLPVERANNRFLVSTKASKNGCISEDLLYQGISSREPGETGIIAVGCPDFVDARSAAEMLTPAYGICGRKAIGCAGLWGHLIQLKAAVLCDKIVHVVDDYHPKVRFLTESITAALKDTPVVLLHGARQTGKTTLVRQLAESRFPARYITLDDAVVLSSARQDPAGFLAALPGPTVIDEIQRAPELFVAIKAEVDRHRRPGRFLLTGSANVFLVPRLSESLAGRMEVLTLRPFSQGELAGIKEGFLDAVFGPMPPPPGPAMPHISDLLLAGGYPPALERADPDRRQAWFGAYVTTILERDIRDLAHLEGLSMLPRLLALIATRAANLVNFADLSRSLTIPQTTLKRYIALLEATFLVELLPAWWSSLGKRLIKAPKLLLNDTGLAGYLLGLNEDRLARDPTLRGALVENFVAMELRKQAAWSRQRPKLFHFRTPAGQEVDLVLENAAGDIVGVEVKASSTVTGRDFNGLRALADLAGSRFRRGVVLYTGPAAVPFGPHLHALPLGSLWAPAAMDNPPEAAR